ncbi:uncharacterized protein SCHCODRAFT_02631088 [Schizophyllum commune H4-8]|uniref:uncharacterized protein n=1 Tax=Schizophyllum commune (strain H4-8 / FGSC 9210) TaxID=578458 RepID=UPI002160D18C|nr:uncharacterized protein SCHCODRAFT_02631084 [Schizophyllum commune H4-8]XP_050199157.1 uncharacterized protein SCHCODRAFT_02631088 [Schizophyllum commune H4-8]KAI5890181.1 hypothetical protein SCHCODRAFT_02631084 [Schizophyllum commune H4-8]KAI5890185.1 hypothetical protein SCHCODRAFT_02631088 [Schizophyllum commune H4-8]
MAGGHNAGGHNAGGHKVEYEFADAESVHSQQFRRTAGIRREGNPRMYQSGSGSRTPAWSTNSKTPNPYANDGGRTPGWQGTNKESKVKAM